MRNAIPYTMFALIAALALTGVHASAQSTFPPAERVRYPAGELQRPRGVLPRGTLDVRMEPGEGSPPNVTWVTTAGQGYVRIPKMSSSFVASEDDTQLAIVFSAEAYTDVSNKRMFVRALIDGEVADPSDVVFTEGYFGGARSFIFTGVVDAGIHTVEMQWLVDPGARAFLRAATLMLRHAGPEASRTVTHYTPPSGPEAETFVSTWAPIPDTSVSFCLPVAAEPIVSFSAETFVAGVDKRMYVRAKIDGVPLSPTDIIFAGRASRQTHTMRFTGPTLPAGSYTASIEWLVDAGGAGLVGDRTILVTAAPQSDQFRHNLVVAPGGPPVSTNSSTWSQVPDLSELIPMPDNAEVAVSFSGEVMGTVGSQLEMRLVAAGEVVVEETAVLAVSNYPVEVMSFTFDHKHIFLPPNTLTGIWLEWRAISGTILMGDRVMEVVIEKGLVPDLAEAPEIGEGHPDYPPGQPVEAAIGTRKLLTIIFRIARARPNDVIPTIPQVTDALYGLRGLNDYYDKVSGGRFSFENAGVLEVNALQTEDHFWNHGPFNCDQKGSDGFTGGHQHRWGEAIFLASLALDFAAFDTDQDGILDPKNELAILIVTPEAEEGGITRTRDPSCNGTDFTADGVLIPRISEVYTNNPDRSWEVMAHELGHLVLGLGDMYVVDDADDIPFDFDTEVGALSLMGSNFNTTTHIDGVTKLALGWATPRYAPYSGHFFLLDVKSSGEVMVLPRDQDGDGKEYFLLEVRLSNNEDDPLYDTGTGCDGIIVWHSVEEPAQNQPPACMTNAEWDNVGSNAQRGVRVIRPDIIFGSGSLSSWDAGDYDLLDVGLSCSVPRRNALLWSDGTASGWRIRNFSAPSAVMAFNLDRP